MLHILSPNFRPSSTSSTLRTTTTTIIITTITTTTIITPTRTRLTSPSPTWTWIWSEEENWRRKGAVKLFYILFKNVNLHFSCTFILAERKSPPIDITEYFRMKPNFFDFHLLIVSSHNFNNFCIKGFWMPWIPMFFKWAVSGLFLYFRLFNTVVSKVI